MSLHKLQLCLRDQVCRFRGQGRIVRLTIMGGEGKIGTHYQTHVHRCVPIGKLLKLLVALVATRNSSQIVSRLDRKLDLVGVYVPGDNRNIYSHVSLLWRIRLTWCDRRYRIIIWLRIWVLGRCRTRYLWEERIPS